MNENDKRNFILGIFKDTDGSTIRDIESIFSKIGNCREYEQTKKEAKERNDDLYNRYLEINKGLYDFPNDTELSSEDIKQILEYTYRLEGNYYNVDELKSEIIEYIFKHVTDDCKLDFIQSEEFQGLYSNADWKGKEFANYYNINTILQTVSEEKTKEMYKNMSRENEAKLKQQLGLLDNHLTLKKAIDNYSSALSNGTDEYIERKQEELELHLALNGIEVDLNELSNEMNAGAFLNSEKFKTLINNYYQNLDEEERIEFIEDLSYGNKGGWREEWLYYDDKSMISNLHIFNAIESSEKYEYAGINILAGVLENDLAKEDKIDIILKMYELNPKDEYIFNYLERQKEGKFHKFELTANQIIELINICENIDNEKLAVGIFSSISSANIIEYLQTKPENISYCMNALQQEEAAELLSTFDDERYKARLLMSLGTDTKEIAKLFTYIEDDYVRAQIIIAKSPNNADGRFYSMEDTLERIDRFLEIKEQFYNLPENERIDFLCNLEEDEPQNPESYIYKETNEIKKTFIKDIENPDERKKVIESMGRYVDPDIKEYTELAEKMIREYLEDNCELTQEQKERMEIEFKTNDVFFTNYDSPSTNGKCRYLPKDVTIANHRRGDTQNIIIDLLHEYSHALSNANYITTAYHVGKTFEEGMADTFAEQVVNYYFAKYNEVEINGEVFEPMLPLISSSSYKFENGWVKSMLYPLEETGEDKKAIQEFVLGDKKIFFDLSLGEGFSAQFEQDYIGNPVHVKFSEEDLANANQEGLYDISRDSLYLIKNDRIDSLSNLAQSYYNDRVAQERLAEEAIRFRTNSSSNICSNTRYGKI